MRDECARKHTFPKNIIDSACIACICLRHVARCQKIKTEKNKARDNARDDKGYCCDCAHSSKNTTVTQDTSWPCEECSCRSISCKTHATTAFLGVNS